MNIKKLFIIASITAQLSTILHADQAAWNAAFTAITGITDPKIAAVSVLQNSKSSSEASKKLKPLNTPEAGAVAAFVSQSNKTSFKTTFKDTDVKQALLVAQGLAQAPSSTAVQLSDAVNVPANWTAAFAAFGGAQGVYDKTATQKTMPASLPANSAAYKDAQVIVQYLGATPTVKGDMSGVLNSVDKTNLDAAFTAANVQRASAPTQTAADINAAALKAQIESAKVLYNQYLTTQGKPALYVAQ